MRTNTAKQSKLIVLFFGGILIFGFCLLPVVASHFSWYRHSLWNHFLRTTQKSQTLNPFEYWQFRERYSPGSFHYNSQAVTMQEILEIDHITDPSTTLLLYTSPRITSSESVVRSANAADSLAAFRQTGSVLYADSSSVIVDSGTSISIAFIQSLATMKRVVGLFNFSDKELKLLTNMVWFHQSTIQR